MSLNDFPEVSADVQAHRQFAEDGHRNVLAELARPFPASAAASIPKAGKKMSYLPWEVLFLRLQAIFGLDWNYEVLREDLKPSLDDGKYMAYATVRVSVPNGKGGYTHRDGVGAKVDKDAEFALKTAQSNAFAKACMGLFAQGFQFKEDFAWMVGPAHEKGGAL